MPLKISKKLSIVTDFPFETSPRSGREVDGPEVGIRKKVFWKIEVQVEAGKVPLLLFYQFLNLELREDHASLGVVGMGQRQKALRKQVLVTDWSGVMSASWGQVTAGGNFTRTPS